MQILIFSTELTRYSVRQAYYKKTHIIMLRVEIWTMHGHFTLYEKTLVHTVGNYSQYITYRGTVDIGYAAQLVVSRRMPHGDSTSLLEKNNTCTVQCKYIWLSKNKLATCDVHKNVGQKTGYTNTLKQTSLFRLDLCRQNTKALGTASYAIVMLLAYICNKYINSVHVNDPCKLGILIFEIMYKWASLFATIWCFCYIKSR